MSDSPGSGAGAGAPFPLRDSIEIFDHGDGEAAARCSHILSQLESLMVAMDRADPEDNDRGGGHIRLSLSPFGAQDAQNYEEPLLGDLRLDEGIAAMLAGAHGAVAALAGLRWSAAHDERVGIDVVTLEVLGACLGDALPRAWCPRPSRPTGGARLRTRVYRCLDGFVAIAIPTDVHWSTCAAMLGISDGSEEAVESAAAIWALSRSRFEAADEAQLWRIPAVPVLSMEEAWAEAVSETEATDSADRPLTLTLSPEVGAGTPHRSAGVLAQSVSAEQSGHRDPPLPIGLDIARRSAPTWGRWFPGKISSAPATVQSSKVAERIAIGIGSLPLSDIVVLDLGSVWAGPYCGRLLAGLGATVIKVEAPGRPDGPRPPDDWDGCWGAFADLNRGKQSLAIDLGRDAGRAAFLRLAANADVVLENFSPRVVGNLGLDYVALSAVNPRLNMLSMPAFDPEGPWANYLSYGSGLEFATGLWDLNEDGVPQAAPIPYLDYLAGVYGAAAVLAALLVRDVGGSGAHIVLPQHDVARQLLWKPQMGDAAKGDALPSSNSSPSSEEETGTAALRQAESDAIEEQLLTGKAPASIGVSRRDGYGDAWSSDQLPRQRGPRFAVDVAALVRRLGCPPSKSEQALAASSDRSAPAVVGRPTGCDASHADCARGCDEGLLACSDGQSAGGPCFHFTRLPWRMYDVPSFRESPAPALGQHSVAVLRSLGGCGPSVIQQLVRDGVVLDAASPRATRRPA